MNFKKRLTSLEQGNHGTLHDGNAAVMRTEEQKQIDMELWLHCHQITHDEIDREAALAHARHLHQTPIDRPSFYTPMPVDVQNELDAHRDEVLKSHAAHSKAERAKLEASARRQEELAATFLADAVAGIH